MMDPTIPPVIQVAGLEAGYDDRLILNGIDLHVDRGEIALIAGSSGCGKSTLLKTIIGLLLPRSGHIQVLGQDLWTLSEEEQKALRRRLGVLFQQGALLNSLTVGENVGLPLEMHTSLPPRFIEDIVRTRLHLVGLDQAFLLFPAELSGGMRKRAALARAMALEPEVVFCDEPGAGLDPGTAAGIDHLLLTLNQTLGTTFVIITHELLSIQRLDGRLILLEAGKVAFTGSIPQAQASEIPPVARFFHPGEGNG